MIHRPTALIALCLMLSSLVSSQVRTPEDWDWVDDHRSKAFEMLMPVERLDRGGAYVAYRQYRDLYQDVPEQYFTICVMDSAGALEATIVTPVGASIQRQLREMHMTDRHASLEVLLSRIAVQRHELTSTTCTALRPRLDALSMVAVPIPTRDTIVLHPFMHRIVLDFSSWNIDAELYRDEHPLVQWARTTFDALSRCTKGR